MNSTRNIPAPLSLTGVSSPTTAAVGPRPLTWTTVSGRVNGQRALPAPPRVAPAPTPEQKHPETSGLGSREGQGEGKGANNGAGTPGKEIIRPEGEGTMAEKIKVSNRHGRISPWQAWSPRQRTGSDAGRRG
jgi:hypothetical protein